MTSLWQNTEQKRYPSLEKEISTDVLIIGGGMAGILCAKALKDKGIDCVITEAKYIGSGVSGKTTAVVSAQHDILYSDIVRKFDDETAKLYLTSNLRGLNRIKELSEKYPCDFEEIPTVVFSQNNADKMKEEVYTLRRFGFNARFISDIPLPISCKGGVVFPKQGQIHPIKLIQTIAKELTVYENTFIKRIENNIAYTNKHKIKANKIIIATHFPFINKYGLFPVKLYQNRSYVIALKNAPLIHGSYADNSISDFYFRSYKNLLLVGGGDHRTGKCKGGYETLREFIRKNFPDAIEEYAWSTQDCMSLDGLPYIGRYSPSLPNVYVATGFNEWGMTPSAVAAELLCNLITQTENKYEKIYSPSRSILHPQLLANAANTIVDFLYPTAKRCSHLGCSLKYNKFEHSYDCPCHGSRFDENGALLDNPATKNAKIK